MNEQHNDVADSAEQPGLLTSQRRAEFEQSGIVRLPGAIGRRETEQMCDLVWEVLARRYEIRRDDPRTWKAQRITGTHDLPKSATFQQIGSPAVCSALDVLLGGDWQRPLRWGSLLVTFPDTGGQWNIPHQTWHLDFPLKRRIAEPFGVRLFTCLAKLPPGGGGTVFVAGSHRLARNLLAQQAIDTLRSADVTRMLTKRYPWMKALRTKEQNVESVRYFMASITMLDDVEARVVEMTGEPGDVYLTHPLMMHAVSSNCTDAPRIVLSSTIYRAGVDPLSLYSRRDAPVLE